MADWTPTKIPDQTGKIIVITGASNGLGLASAGILAARGAEITLAVRDAARGEAAAQKIRAAHPGAKLTVSLLDLASLDSVAHFAARTAETLPRIDVLLNNAGLGMQPTRRVTKDGFEQMFGVNHLGHFALTARLVPLLLQAPAPRVVVVASNAHKRGAIAWDDVQAEKSYAGPKVYAQSKLANLMFALELASRAKAQNSRLLCAAAHPGLAATNFIAATEMPGIIQKIAHLTIGLIGQPAEAGAWPQEYAATMPDVANGDYWGPDGFMAFKGKPQRETPRPQAQNLADRSRLWTLSEQLTGVTFPALA
jgi:NAD(P)-dependent dehydrogenase (short-subunit alcohol dehydrogenase family)